MTAVATSFAMAASAPERVTVQYVFSLRTWTPKSARAWVLQRGYTIHAVQSNDHVSIVHIRPPTDYVVRTLQRSYLAGSDGITVGEALLRGSLVGQQP